MSIQIILISGKILPSDKFLILSLSAGLGALFACGDANLVLFSVLSCLLLINFKNKNKFLYASMALISIGLIVFIENQFDLIEVIFSFLSILTYI